ncbi:MAG: hypothetical protein K1X38_05030 [Microthrixaceae bacterium]|nr:hypothetical protein [Microthrixaceae bacterium]
MPDRNDRTDRTEQRHRNREIGLGLVGVALTMAIGYTTVQSQRSLDRIENERHEEETAHRDAVDFTTTYFASTCSERMEQVSFPLTQWMNWREGQMVRVYEAPAKPNKYVPFWPSEPQVMGTSQEAGQPLAAPDAEQLRQEQQRQDMERLGGIREAVEKEHYQLSLREPIPATERESVEAQCLNGRSQGQNMVQPEIPTEIVQVSPLSDKRTRVVVRVIADLANSDHIADRESVYSLLLVRTDDGLRLKSLAGIIVGDG